MSTVWMAPHKWERVRGRDLGLFQRCMHCYRRKWSHPVGWWVPARPLPFGVEDNGRRSPTPGWGPLLGVSIAKGYSPEIRFGPVDYETNTMPVELHAVPIEEKEASDG